MSDIYTNFEELQKNHTEGVDYFVEQIDQRSFCVVIAIHGGLIEPGTTEVARSIAGDEYSFYTFKSADEHLHITSSNFDEPRALALVRVSEMVVSVHGKKGIDEFIMVGGLDADLVAQTNKALEENGFVVKTPSENVSGMTTQNVCNRGLTKKGLQLEISRGLRNKLLSDPVLLAYFSGVIREVIKSKRGINDWNTHSFAVVD